MIASSAMKPMLCRLPAYFGPGLPSPASSTRSDATAAGQLQGTSEIGSGGLLGFRDRFLRSWLGYLLRRGRGDAGDSCLRIILAKLDTFRQLDRIGVNDVAQFQAGEIDG